MGFRIDLQKSGSSGTLMLSTTSVAHRRATDGMLPRAAGMGRVVGMVGGRIARAVAVAIVDLDDGPAVCRRPAGGVGVDSHGGPQRRLPGLLLLPAEHWAALAGAGATRVGVGLAPRAGKPATGAAGNRRGTARRVVDPRSATGRRWKARAFITIRRRVRPRTRSATGTSGSRWR